MSIVKIIDDYLLQFGNERFMEGWNGATDHIVNLLKPHRPTGKSVGGFLGVCSCGEAIDDYQEHLIALIKGEQK